MAAKPLPTEIFHFCGRQPEESLADVRRYLMRTMAEQRCCCHGDVRNVNVNTVGPRRAVISSDRTGRPAEGHQRGGGGEVVVVSVGDFLSDL